MSDKPTFEVELFFSPALSSETFAGKASTLTSENSVGKFDILPHHANFITQIFNHLIIRTPNQKDRSFDFKRGVLEVSEDKVKIFLGI